MAETHDLPDDPRDEQLDADSTRSDAPEASEETSLLDAPDPGERANETGAADAAVDEASAADDADEPTAPSEEELAAQQAEAALLNIFQSTVYGSERQKIGRVGQVYLDDQTQEPNWVTVKTGLFGTKEFFVPLDEAETSAKRIEVPYTKEQVTSAPYTEVDQNLSPEEEDALYNYYRVPGRMTDPAVIAAVASEDAVPVLDADAEPIESAPMSEGAEDQAEDTTAFEPVSASEPVAVPELVEGSASFEGADTVVEAPEQGDSPFERPADER